jgi:hypothetical protein
VNQNLRLFLFFGLGLLLILSRILGKSGCKDQKSSRNRLFIKVCFLLKQNRTKKLIMRKSITALFLFSIVALVVQSQITTNQKTSIQQGTIQKVAVLKDTQNQSRSNSSN